MKRCAKNGEGRGEAGGSRHVRRPVTYECECESACYIHYRILQRISNRLCCAVACSPVPPLPSVPPPLPFRRAPARPLR